MEEGVACGHKTSPSSGSCRCLLLDGKQLSPGRPRLSHAATERQYPQTQRRNHVISGGDVGLLWDCGGAVRRTREGEDLFVKRLILAGQRGAHPKLPAGPTEITWTWDLTGLTESARPWHAEGDPVLLFARELIETGGVSRDEIQRLDGEVRKEADEAARFALESPLPDPKAALNFAYAGGSN